MERIAKNFLGNFVIERMEKLWVCCTQRIKEVKDLEGKNVRGEPNL